jgi:hypothetical protein
MPVTFSNFTPANIGANFMAGRKEAQDMETGRLQQQEARMKLEDFQRKQAGLDQFLVDYEKHGQTGDPEFLAGNLLKYAVSQRNPELITQARTLVQTAQQRKKFNAMQNPNQLAGVARPTAPAGALGSGTFDPYAAAPTNALAPTAALSVMTPSNALAPRAAAPAAPAKTDRVAEIEKRLSFLNEFRDLPDAKDEATRLVKEYERLTTPVTIASGSSIYNPQTGTFTQAPAAQTDIARLVRERDALPLGDPNRKLYDKEISDRGAANRNAQQRLDFDRSKFEWEKKNPTKTIQDDGTGLVAVDTRTGIATPVVYGPNGIQAAPAAPSVTVDGRSFPGLRTEAPASRAGTQVPGKPKAIPEAYAKQAMGVLNTNDALQTLQDVTQKFTAADMVDPVKRAQIGQAHATTLLFAKEMFNLGVLNGGDERIVNSVINNPIDFSSSIIPIEAIRKQARDLQDVVERTNKNLSTVYKLPPQELKRTSPASGGSDVRSAADNILKGK